ncbi:ADP compounds hydrolase NudE [Gallaecimonas xiamenensis]|uniref:Adenosine nucleotide hydrolase NudE n=1 Tax=Gallaecimonas xiamenensis 3-C-1 TaxID=745411 RepID=K2K3P0_9GAMM|nr:ADP compounds hydrolase NudE [Gallaecimonas xiamenensis]EKE77569.1 adenosine nucleotide hydrolase NudE [Gallaecimonas xiamenensis 3-C-1]
MTKSAKLPEVIDAQIVAESRLFKVEQLHLRFTNGAERHYERMKGSGRGSVMVVPLLDDHTLLLGREYAAGLHAYELGFPKGLIDPGEDAIEAANRELQEEIGYGARDWTVLREVSMAPGYFSAKMTLLIARDLYPSRLEGDEPEPIEVVPWPLARINELRYQKDFSEARSLTALLLARDWLQEQALL